MAGDDSTQVAYSGKPLESGRDYWWKARCRRQTGEARPAPRGSAGLVRNGAPLPLDWKASRIGGGAAKRNQFRKVFTIQGKVQNARIYIAALLGYYGSCA